MDTITFLSDTLANKQTKAKTHGRVDKGYL